MKAGIRKKLHFLCPFLALEGLLVSSVGWAQAGTEGRTPGEASSPSWSSQAPITLNKGRILFLTRYFSPPPVVGERLTLLSSTKDKVLAEMTVQTLLKNGAVGVADFVDPAQGKRFQGRLQGTWLARAGEAFSQKKAALQNPFLAIHGGYLQEKSIGIDFLGGEDHGIESSLVAAEASSFLPPFEELWWSNLFGVNVHYAKMGVTTLKARGQEGWAQEAKHSGSEISVTLLIHHRFPWRLLSGIGIGFAPYQQRKEKLSWSSLRGAPDLSKLSARSLERKGMGVSLLWECQPAGSLLAGLQFDAPLAQNLVVTQEERESSPVTTKGSFTQMRVSPWLGIRQALLEQGSFVLAFEGSARFPYTSTNVKGATIARNGPVAFAGWSSWFLAGLSLGFP